MRNVALLCALMVLLSGCLVRSYTVEKPRSDVEISGNRGFLSGEAPAEEGQIEKTTRRHTVFEVELGSHRPDRKKAEKAGSAEPAEETGDELEASYMEEEDIFEEEFIIEGSEPAAEAREYTVEKNDTLQKISQKFYGTTKKYLKLYEYNKEVMKSPDRLYPGMKLKIPALD